MTQALAGERPAGIPWSVRWLTLGAALASITACAPSSPPASQAQTGPGGDFAYVVENRVDVPYTLVIEESGRTSSTVVVPPCNAQGGGASPLAAEWSIRLYEGVHEPAARPGHDPLGGEPPGEPIGLAHSHEHPSFPVYLYIVIEPFRVGPLDFGRRARFERRAEHPNSGFDVFSPDNCS